MSIRSELSALKEQHGELLKPETIHDWVKAHPGSDTYASLEWDNAVGGYQWRLQQIRGLVRIHLVNEDGVREFVSLQIDRAQPGGGYRSRAEVMASPPLRELLLKDALAALYRIKAQYESLNAELRPVWDSVEMVEARFQKTEEKVDQAQAG